MGRRFDSSCITPPCAPVIRVRLRQAKGGGVLVAPSFLGRIEISHVMLTGSCETADRIFPRHLHRPRLDQRLFKNWKVQIASQALIIHGRRLEFFRAHLHHHNANQGAKRFFPRVEGANARDCRMSSQSTSGLLRVGLDAACSFRAIRIEKISFKTGSGTPKSHFSASGLLKSR
jgi:hypothetical protein